MFNLAIRGLGILNYQSSYLSGETAWLKRTLSGIVRPTVFDVGANVGKYTAEVISVSPSALVYAFEPHPKNVARLKDSIGSEVAGGGIDNQLCGWQ